MTRKAKAPRIRTDWHAAPPQPAPPEVPTSPYRWLTYPGRRPVTTQLVGPNSMNEYWLMITADYDPAQDATRCGYVVAPAGYRQPVA